MEQEVAALTKVFTEKTREKWPIDRGRGELERVNK